MGGRGPPLFCGPLHAGDRNTISSQGLQNVLSAVVKWLRPTQTHSFPASLFLRV